MAAESEWKVFFEGDFWYHSGRDHAGKELRTEKEFEWAGHEQNQNGRSFLRGTFGIIPAGTMPGKSFGQKRSLNGRGMNGGYLRSIAVGKGL